MSDAPRVKIPQPADGRSLDRLAMAGYLVVAVLLFWPLPLSLTTHMTGDPFGDPLLNAWILGWDADRLAHGLHGFWQAPLFYPAPDTLAWSEHLLGIGVFVAPFYWLTGNIVLVYNLALIGSTALSGAGMYLLAREITGRRDAAWLAGLLFACLPYRVAQHTHLQVLMTGWMPLALLGLHRYVSTGSRRALAGFVVAFLLTALSNGYFVFFLAVPVSIVAGWSLVGRLRQRDRVLPTLGALGLAALAIGVVLAPVAAAYVRVRETQGFTRTRGEMVNYAARPASYLAVSSKARVLAGVLPVGRNERELFPGVTLLALAAAGLAASRHQGGVKLYAAVALTGFLLSLGPEPDLGFIHLPAGPYDLLLAIPGAGGLRVPARLAVVVYLGLAVIAARGAQWLLTRTTPRHRLVLVVLLSATSIGEGLSSVAVVPTTPQFALTREAYTWLADQDRGPMLELPVAGTRPSVLYLAGTLVHRNRIVNGYSGYGSAMEDLFAGSASNEPSNAAELLRAARAIGVRYVLVHEHQFADRAFAASLVRAMRARPDHVEFVKEINTTAVVVLRPMPKARGVRPAGVLPLEGCHVQASHNPDTAERAIDRDMASRWVTGVPQRGDEWFLVDCVETRVLTGIDLRVDRRSFSDYPRDLAIDVSADGATFQTVWQGGVLAELAVSLASNDRPPASHIDLPPAPFRAMRLRQVGQTPRRWVWSIDELQLRGR